MTGDFWFLTRGAHAPADPFERTMSTLTAATGDAERLEGLTPDQLDRVRTAATRLTAAYYQHRGPVDPPKRTALTDAEFRLWFTPARARSWDLLAHPTDKVVRALFVGQYPDPTRFLTAAQTKAIQGTFDHLPRNPRGRQPNRWRMTDAPTD